MNDYNVFSYMDSEFMHSFDGKLSHIRPLRAADFQEQESTFDAHGTQDLPHRDPSPPKLLVRIAFVFYYIAIFSWLPLDRVEARRLWLPALASTRSSGSWEALAACPWLPLDRVEATCEHLPSLCLILDFSQENASRESSPVVGIENMDIDPNISDAEDYAEAEDPEDEREAPSEQDTDEANSEHEHDPQPSPLELHSPMRGKTLDFDSAMDSRRDQPAQPDAEAEDERDAVDREADDEDDQEDVHDSDREDVGHEGREHIDDAHDAGSISGSSDEIGQDLPPPISAGPSASTKKRHVSSKSPSKDLQWRRRKHRQLEPVITEAMMEDKIVGILSKTLPQMLSGMFQEVLSQAKVHPSQQAAHVAPSLYVAPATQPELPPMRSAVVQTDMAVGVQGVDVVASLNVDTAGMDVDVPTREVEATAAALQELEPVDIRAPAGTNVSFRSPCFCPL